MNRTASRPSLRTRIIETQTRATYSVDGTYLARHRQESFVERYRGTEYESPTTILVVREPLVSRGRSLVLVMGATVVGVTAVILAAAPA